MDGQHNGQTKWTDNTMVKQKRTNNDLKKLHRKQNMESAKGKNFLFLKQHENEPAVLLI